MMRGGAVVARQAHNLEAAGSTPAPGTDHREPYAESPPWRMQPTS